MSDAHPETQGIRVLIAEDDRTFATSLQELIDRQPHLSVVGVAADGLQAIELVDRLGPDAVVLDLHMPLLDGVTAAARLHAAVREAGADAVLLKGQMVDALVRRLGAVRVAATR